MRWLDIVRGRSSGTCRRVEVGDDVWRLVKMIDGAWKRVILPSRIVVAYEWFDEDDFSQKSRSERVLSDGAICGLIGEGEAMVVSARQWSLMYLSCGGGSGFAHNDDHSG